MNKNTILFLIFLILTGITGAQSVQVIEKKEITSPEQGQFFYPQFSNKGSSILFTGDAYRGLWLSDNEGNNLRKLNDFQGAGNNPVFESSDNSIIFRAYKFEKMKRISSLYSQDLSSGTVTPIIEGSRDLYPPMKGSLKSVNVVDNGEAQKVSNSLRKSLSASDDQAVYVDNSKIILLQNGSKKILEPLGKGNYLWTSISPDGTRLLFTKAGSGTFVSDLDGNILYELGKANYPVWAKDGNWVLYMNDTDDGNVFISSEVEIVNLDTMERVNLTNTGNTIEMYPDYSLKTDEVVYHTLEGQIIKLKLKFN